jgi:hypothetical protein
MDIQLFEEKLHDETFGKKVIATTNCILTKSTFSFMKSSGIIVLKSEIP